MHKILLACLAMALGAGCHTAPAISADAGALVPSESPSASAHAPSGTRRPAEITPEIVAKATEILWANNSAKVGTEFPFDLNGKHYIARMEMHDNPDCDPARPQGEHKGMTVYIVDE